MVREVHMERITDIQSAQQIINKLKLDSITAAGSAFHNPVFDKLNSAQKYLSKQVEEFLAE